MVIWVNFVFVLMIWMLITKKMKAKGVQMLNIDGSPLDSKNCVLEPYGEKMAYFPSELTCGMIVEVVQPSPDETLCIPPRSFPRNGVSPQSSL